MKAFRAIKLLLGFAFALAALVFRFGGVVDAIPDNNSYVTAAQAAAQARADHVKRHNQILSREESDIELWGYSRESAGGAHDRQDEPSSARSMDQPAEDDSYYE